MVVRKNVQLNLCGIQHIFRTHLRGLYCEFSIVLEIVKIIFYNNNEILTDGASNTP